MTEPKRPFISGLLTSPFRATFDPTGISAGGCDGIVDDNDEDGTAASASLPSRMAEIADDENAEAGWVDGSCSGGCELNTLVTKLPPPADLPGVEKVDPVPE